MQRMSFTWAARAWYTHQGLYFYVELACLQTCLQCIYYAYVLDMNIRIQFLQNNKHSISPTPRNMFFIEFRNNSKTVLGKNWRLVWHFRYFSLGRAPAPSRWVVCLKVERSDRLIDVEIQSMSWYLIVMRPNVPLIEFCSKNWVSSLCIKILTKF